jgi:hypothetical protein
MSIGAVRIVTQHRPDLQRKTVESDVEYLTASPPIDSYSVRLAPAPAGMAPILAGANKTGLQRQPGGHPVTRVGPHLLVIVKARSKVRARSPGTLKIQIGRQVVAEPIGDSRKRHILPQLTRFETRAGDQGRGRFGVSPDITIAAAQHQLACHIHQDFDLLLVVVHHQLTGQRQRSGLGNRGGRQDHVDEQTCRGGMQVIGHQGLDEPHALQGAQLETKASGSMRLLGFGELQSLLTGVKQQRAEHHDTAVIELVIVDIGFGEAIQKLAVEIQPGDRAGSEQALGINAVAADSISLRQSG